MGRETLTAGHKIKKAFLREAIKEGVYLKRPRYTSPDEWSKQRKIGFRYAFQDITLEELGKQYGGTRANISLINHNFLDNIHKNSPPELQAQYPRVTIPDRNPIGQRSREMFSTIRGGLSLQAKELVEQGITDPKQIQQTLEISSGNLAKRRNVLKGWGIDIPRVHKSPNENFKK